MRKFERDLEFGQIGERVVADFLEQEFMMELHAFNVSSDKGKLKEFDFTVMDWKAGRFLDVEVKTDAWEFFKQKNTGNITIEYSCNGIASGLFATKADKFVYYMPFHEIMYMVDTDVLIELLKTAKIPYQPKDAGDGKRARVALISREEFDQHFTAIRIPKKYIQKYIN